MPRVGEEGPCRRALEEQTTWDIRPLEEAGIRSPCPAHEEEEGQAGWGGQADRKGKTELLDLNLRCKLGGDVGGEAGGDLDDDDLGGVNSRVIYQPCCPVINSIHKV